MSQHDLDIANATGALARADINNALVALGSCMKGPSAPSAPVAGMVWVDDDTPSSTLWTVKQYDGADWIEVGLIDVTNNKYFWSFNNLTAETAPAVGDLLPIYDVSAGSYRKMTLENLVALINVLTAETSPAEADLVAIYDVSASAPRKQTRANFLSGTVAQVQHASTSAVGTTSTALPVDDTIPQNTEGAEALTVTITPKSASNRLLIEANLFVALNNAGGLIACALFQDSTANALTAAATACADSNDPSPLQLRHEMAAGTTSATTFKVRYGPASGSNTATVNGGGGSRFFNTLPKSSITVTEIRA